MSRARRPPATREQFPRPQLVHVAYGYTRAWRAAATAGVPAQLAALRSAALMLQAIDPHTPAHDTVAMHQRLDRWVADRGMATYTACTSDAYLPAMADWLAGWLVQAETGDSDGTTDPVDDR